MVTLSRVGADPGGRRCGYSVGDVSGESERARGSADVLMGENRWIGVMKQRVASENRLGTDKTINE